MYQEPRTEGGLCCSGNTTNAVRTEATVPDEAEFGCNRVLQNIRAQQHCPHGECYSVVAMLGAATAISHSTGSFVNSAFCKRCISKLEAEIVAITIAHGMTGEIQKNGVAKLISAIQARLAKVLNKNATRREPDLNGKGTRHKACTITAKGKPTTRCRE